MTDNKERIMYGVWIPKQGWLRGKDVFCDYNVDKAWQVARLIGRGAIVRYIDEAIIDMEKYYLEQEGKSLWHTFKNLFKHKKST